MKIIDNLERPIVALLIMGAFSTAAAIIFFMIGGSIASVTAEDDMIVDAGFKASGTIAGYIIIFWLFAKVYARLTEDYHRELKDVVYSYLIRLPSNGFDRTAGPFTCSYKLFTVETGWSDWQPIDYTRSPSGDLTIRIQQMTPQHTIRVKLEDGQNGTWESREDLAFGVSPIYLNPVRGN